MIYHRTSNPDFVVGELDLRPLDQFLGSVNDRPNMARQCRYYLLFERNRPQIMAHAAMYLDRGQTWCEYMHVDEWFRREGRATFLWRWIEAKHGPITVDESVMMDPAASFLQFIREDNTMTYNINGWIFERLDNGQVVVRHESHALQLNESEWASIIAAMSTGQSYDTANAFHRGQALRWVSAAAEG